MDRMVSNPYLLGVPCVSFLKYLKVLIEYNYTIIQIDQITPPPKPRREVVAVHSKGTFINDIQTEDSNNIISLYIEDEIQKNGRTLICIGMSVIDLSVGSSTIYEAISSFSDDKFALDEASRFINTYNPTEIIIYKKTLNKNCKNISVMDKNSIILY